MASSPTSRPVDAPPVDALPVDAPPDLAFVLQELATCWDQGYEALVRGDLERVEALLGIADDFTAKLAQADLGSRKLSELHRKAQAARGRLEHAMKSGLTGLREELRKTREGTRALSGYRHGAQELGRRVERDA